MARANTIQTNFTSGEVSPLMYGRVDVAKYFNGARKLQNMVVRPQGGIVRRSGTRFVSEVRDSTKFTRLRRFIFSDAQPYILEFSDTNLRIYKNGAALLDNTSTVITITTPWAYTDLSGLAFTQSADVLYVTHPNYQPRTISRILDPTFGFITFQINAYVNYDGPFLDVDTSGTRLQVTDVVDDAVMTMSFMNTQVAVATSAIFANTDTNKYIEFKDKLGRWTLSQATGFTDTTHDPVTIILPSAIIYYPNTYTVTFSGGQVTSTFPIFLGSSSAYVGKFIRLSGSQAWYTITSVISSTVVGVTALTLVSYNTSTVTVTIASAFTNADVNSFIAYRANDQWNLAKITSFVDSEHVHVTVQDQIVRPNPAAKITFATGHITSDLAGVFIPTTDAGRYIRTTDTGLWYQLTAYVNSSNWSATLVTTKVVSYPNTTITVGTRTITYNVNADTQLFSSTDTGRWLRLQFGARIMTGTITNFLTQYQVSAQIGQFDTHSFPIDHDNAAQIYNNGYADAFRLGAWSITTGWPSRVSFHEQRLVFGKTAFQPTTIWGSKSGDYTDHAPTDISTDPTDSIGDLSVLPDSAYTFTITSNRVNPITWMDTGAVMLIGTIGAEHQVKATSLNEPITPANVDVKEQTAYGSIQNDESHRIGSAFLFIQRGGNKVREMTYDFTIDSFVSKDITIIAEHIMKQFGGGVISTYQQEPTGIVWVVCSTGDLVSMTYERDQEVVAWTRHKIGGSGIVESIECVPSVNTDRKSVV